MDKTLTVVAVNIMRCVQNYNHTEVYMTIQEKFKVLRKERGLKQSQLAEMCRVSDAAIGAWEQGVRIPFFDNLVSLADAFGVSLDVFRQDVKRLDLPHPTGKSCKNTDEDETSFEDIPLAFGSSEPDENQTEILKFCNHFLDFLDEKFFIKGVGQNNKDGTGRYFWESKIDILMFIGYTPFLQDDKNNYAFSIAVNTEKPIPEEYLSSLECLQFSFNPDENWIYFPIAIMIENENGDYSPELLESAKTALLDAMKLNRILLVIDMQEYMNSKNNEA